MKTRLKGLFSDKEFFTVLFKIALPIVIQNFIASSLNMVDTLMIGKVQEAKIESLAAVGIANQYFFFFNLIIFGLYSGCCIFISQYWGREDKKSIKKVLGVSLVSGSIIAIIFTIIGLIAPNFIISLFNKDAKVISLGVDYLRIVVISYIFTAISFAFSFACRSVGQATIPMFVSLIALVTNTILNYALIFGKFGMPVMGVKGAALATLISRVIETVVLLIIIYTKSDVLNAKIKELLDFNMGFVKHIYKTISPVIINETLWSLGMLVYAMAYGVIGKEAVAAVQICNTVQNLFYVIIAGISNACAVMIGNIIGYGDKEKGIDYSFKFSIFGTFVGLLLGIALIIFSPPIVKFFNVDSYVYSASIGVLNIMGITMAIKVFNRVLVVGILRGGGDTKFSMYLEVGTVWLVGVPLALLGSYVFKVSLNILFILITMEEVVKFFVGVPRVISKRWVKDLVN
ncbi:MATE family efflux transporter [Hathewaya massiliensis]|uniref:MATE family efflux transporter n=1 Tax=Hathewaya massiliensis TaxID=1964382 RepID=UPI00115BF331|nr:MATE family efflux transporter [Hathewaya massiliensis]